MGSGCAGPDAEKLHYFKPADYHLEYLEKDKTSTMLSSSMADKAKGVVDFADERLEPALAAVPAPAPQIIKMAMTHAKPFIIGALQAQIKKSIEEHADDVNAVVQKYNVFKKDPELGYELIEEPSSEAKGTVNRVNDGLTRAYRTLRAMKVAHKMLVVAKKDAETVKTKPDPASLAGIGIAALSVADLTLHAIEDAKALVPELQGMGNDVTQQATAQPLIAMDLAPAVPKLTGATNDLIALPADAGSVLSDVADLVAIFTDQPGAAPAPTSAE